MEKERDQVDESNIPAKRRRTIKVVLKPKKTNASRASSEEKHRPRTSTKNARKQSAPEAASSKDERESTRQSQKICAFFNTQTGCYRGDSCMFIHTSELSSGIRLKRCPRCRNPCIGRQCGECHCEMLSKIPRRKRPRRAPLPYLVFKGRRYYLEKSPKTRH